MIVLIAKWGNRFAPRIGGQHGIRISIKRLEKMTKHSQKTLRRGIAELKDAGWLNVIPTKSAFGQGANHITVNWHLIRSDCEEQGRQTQLDFFEAAGQEDSVARETAVTEISRQKRDISVTSSDGQIDQGCRSKGIGGDGQTDRGVTVILGGGDGQTDQPCILPTSTDTPTNLPPKNYMHGEDANFCESEGSRQLWRSIARMITRDDLTNPKTIQGLYLDAVDSFPGSMTRAAADRLTFFALCHRFAREQRNNKHRHDNPGGMLTKCMAEGWHRKKGEKAPRIEDEEWARSAISDLDFDKPKRRTSDLLLGPAESETAGFSTEDARQLRDLEAAFGPELESLSDRERGLLFERAEKSPGRRDFLRRQPRLRARLRLSLLRQMAIERRECEVAK